MVCSTGRLSIEILCDPGQHVEHRSKDTRLIVAGSTALSSKRDYAILDIAHVILEGIAEEEWTARVAATGVQDAIADGTDVILANRSTLVVAAADTEILALDHRLQEHRGGLVLFRSTPARNVEALIVGDVPRVFVDGQADGLDVRLELNLSIQLDQCNIIIDGSIVGMWAYLLNAVFLVRRQAHLAPSAQELAVLFGVQIVFSHAHSDAAGENGKRD